MDSDDDDVSRSPSQKRKKLNNSAPETSDDQDTSFNSLNFDTSTPDTTVTFKRAGEDEANNNGKDLEDDTLVDDERGQMGTNTLTTSDIESGDEDDSEDESNNVPLQSGGLGGGETNEEAGENGKEPEKVSLEFIDTGRGRYKKSSILKYDSFLFRQVREKEGVSVMNCREDKCPASITINKEKSLIVSYKVN